MKKELELKQIKKGLRNAFEDAVTKLIQDKSNSAIVNMANHFCWDNNWKYFDYVPADDFLSLNTYKEKLTISLHEDNRYYSIDANNLTDLFAEFEEMFIALHRA